MEDVLDRYRTSLTEEMTQLVVQAMNYMSYVLKRRCTNDTNLVIPPNIVSMGMREDSPADSCQVLHSFKPYLQSGDYWIRQSATSTAVQVHCDMEKDFLDDESKGWMRLVSLNMTDTNTACPGDLTLVNQNVRSCGRGKQEPGCSSAVFASGGIRYSKVCGRVRGYQYSTPNAFYYYTLDQSLTIDDNYVDGVILTHNGPTGRNHIWTFAAALDEVDRPTRQFSCPCTNPGSNNTFLIPLFVGSDYSCDTGSRSTYQYNRFYHEDPLWDGAGCGPASSCCSNGPTFCKALPHSTTDDIELRVCANEPRANEDTPIDLVELYIQ